VPADFTGDEPVIAFNPHYLLDGVIAAMADVSGSPQVRLRFTTGSKPAVITRGGGAGNEFRYLVVPQRLQQ
jgi:DNA polymerase III sliding clamp (beta) subunit (PCNA family)